MKLFGLYQKFHNKSELQLACNDMADQEKIINEVLNLANKHFTNYQQFKNAMTKLRGYALNESFLASEQAQQLYLQIYKKVVGNSFANILANQDIALKDLVAKLTVNEYQFWKYQTQSLQATPEQATRSYNNP